MACNCIEETEKRLAEHVPTTLTGNQKLVKQPKIETIMAITDGMNLKSKTASEITYEIEQTSKNGNVRKIKKATYLCHSHCPWCGVEK